MKEKDFYKKSDNVINYFLETWPVLATQFGEHQRDHKLADYSEQAIYDNYEQIKDYLKEVEEAETERFSKEGQIDYTLMVQTLKSIIREKEVIKSYQRNPNNYLDEVLGGIMVLLLKDFAPLEKRLESILGRLEDTSRVLESARDNIDPAKVPEVWVDVSLEQLQMAPALFQQMLPQMAEQHAPHLAEDIKKAGTKAAEAVQEFTNYLKEKVKLKARGDFSVGEEVFNTLLKEDHMVDYDARELLEIGWDIFEETKEKMKELAREIDPNNSVVQIMEEAKSDHPSAEKLLDAYRESMKKSYNFVVENNIATIPENEELTIVETPEYLRPIIPYAAYMQPGIFEDELKGTFLVTPVNPQASEEKKEEKLKGHYYAKLPITTLHEGYPGHHLQLVWSITHGTNVRKLGMFLSTFFVEGWAFYCEELMEDLGYINTPIQRLGRLSDQLWRAARIILDVKLHCSNMKVDEAVDFLVEECQLERDNAVAEVRRYTSSPTQPQSYLMGKKEILKIIDKYKKENPASSLQKIHDDILAAGSLPPKLLKKHLSL